MDSDEQLLNKTNLLDSGGHKKIDDLFTSERSFQPKCEKNEERQNEDRQNEDHQSEDRQKEDRQKEDRQKEDRQKDASLNRGSLRLANTVQWESHFVLVGSPRTAKNGTVQEKKY